MNCLINEKIKLCINSLSSEQLLHIFCAISLVPRHIQDSDGLLLSRAADDLVVWGYAHCTKSVVISSVSVANLGCSQRHGKYKEECMAQGELDADDWIKVLGILQTKLSSTIKTNTLCHQWLGDRYKRGAFDIGCNIMEQFSASLPH